MCIADGPGALIQNIVFQPPSSSYDDKHDGLIWLKTTQGASIPAFFVPYNHNHDTITILYSHGNAEDIGMILGHIKDLSSRLKCNVLCYEYEGYGISNSASIDINGNPNNKPSESRCYADIDAAWEYLTKVRNYNSENIVIMGISLGSGPSTYLAQRLCNSGIEVGGMILQSAFLSAYRVAFDFRFTLPGDIMSNIDRMADINIPVFVIHGATDEVVPFTNGESLFFSINEEYRCKPLWLHHAGHNDIELVGLLQNDIYHISIRNFFKEWVIKSTNIHSNRMGAN